MGAVVSFISQISDAISSFFHGLFEMIKIVAAVWSAIPTYTGLVGGVIGAWIVAALGCCLLFRVIGRE